MSSEFATSTASGVTTESPSETITTNPYIVSGNTILCDSAISTYISASDSWTTWTAATCMKYNPTIGIANITATPTSSLDITSTESPSTSNGISIVTEFSSTAITTTITPSTAVETQTSGASNNGVSGLTGLIWVLYFSYKLVCY